ncbi:MAG: FAD/NAD(P)-binding protein [Verrucomicrobiota bacterium]
MKRVAIIGGGFSGHMVAVNMARLCQSPVKITVINKGTPPGRGAAYSTRQPEHLLNVVARNMSAFPDHPRHFVQWLETRSEFADTPIEQLREAFIPRRTYGDYLRSIAHPYLCPVDSRFPAAIEPIIAEAVNVTTAESGGTVVLSDDQQIHADKIVLALGNHPPAQLPGAASLATHPAYHANPWVPWITQLPENRHTAITIGTGLTAVDTILTLLEIGWKGNILAVSRNGLLPQSHFKGFNYPDFPPEDPQALGLKDLKAALRKHCDILKQRGANPTIVVDKLRPHTQTIWRRFSLEEKQAFCKNEASQWNVRRHRIAPQVHDRITDAIHREQLKIIKGTVAQLAKAGSRITVSLQDQNSLMGDVVINCTGPKTRFSTIQAPLIQNLLAGGLAHPDEMDMGLKVTDDLAVIDAAGNRSNLLFAIGPLLRGTLWESIAVPELRGQALRIAQTILDELTPAPYRHEPWPSHQEEAVMEYMI